MNPMMKKFVTNAKMLGKDNNYNYAYDNTNDYANVYADNYANV